MSQFMRDYPKRIKKLIREYAAMAYEIELSREIKKLSNQFDHWNEGRINSSELERLIHEFHSGKSQDLFNKYNTAPLDIVLAHAIVTRVISKDKIPDKLLQYLDNAIQFYQEQLSNP